MSGVKHQENEGVYPVGLHVKGRRVVVFGGGKVAERKAMRLLDFGAVVVVIAPEASETLQQAAQTGALEWQQRPASENDLAGALFAVIATNDEDTNTELGAAAQQAGILTLRADNGPSGELVSAATTHCGPATIAVFGNDAGPAFSTWLRNRIEASLPPHVADVAKLFSEIRARLAAMPDKTSSERAELLGKIVDTPAVLQMLIHEGYEAGLAHTLEALGLTGET